MSSKKKKRYQKKRKKQTKAKLTLNKDLDLKVGANDSQTTNHKLKTINHKQQPINRKSLPPNDALNSLWQYLTLALVILAVIFSLAWVYRTYTADKDYKLGKAYIQAGQYQKGFSLMEQAVKKAPKEALFYSDLSFNQARLALVFAKQKQTQQASQATQIALETSNRVMQLNPLHINFYKTQARTLSLLAATNEILAQLDKSNSQKWQVESTRMLKLADESLQRARHLAPNEPSLSLDQAKIKNALGETSAARALFEETIKLKPDYADALWAYGQFLETQGDYQRAKAVYQQYLDLVDGNSPQVKQKLKEINDLLATQSGKIKPNI